MGICYFFFVSAIICVLCLTPSQTCDVGWTSYGGDCYKLVDGTSVTESRTTCLALGGDLVVPADQAEINFLKDNLAIDWAHFIGITDNAEEGVWTTFSGCPVPLLPGNWNTGEPGKDPGIENCALMDWVGKYRDISCFYVPFASKGYCKRTTEPVNQALAPDSVVMSSFKITRQHYLNVESQTQTTAAVPSVCATLCLNNDKCLSFNYSHKDGSCFINTVSHFESFGTLLPNAHTEVTKPDIHDWSYGLKVKENAC